MSKNFYALGRLRTGQKNKTEQAYELEVLKPALHAGQIVWYRFEGIKFKLADKTYYTPDYCVMRSDGTMEMHEVKGFWQDDARVKIKVAADMYPLKFIAVKRQAKKNGGGWSTEEF